MKSQKQGQPKLPKTTTPPDPRAALLQFHWGWGLAY